MAGGCVMGLDLVDGATQSSAARRQATIGNRRIRVVDIHAHWEMALPEIVKGTPLEKTAPPFVMRSPGPGLAERIAIFDGTFDKFPGLRVCGAHGGGYLPSYLGRSEVACVRPNTKCLQKRRPSEYLRQQVLADTMVFSEEGLRHLVVNASFLSDADKEAILGGNLIRLLRMPAQA